MAISTGMRSWAGTSPRAPPAQSRSVKRRTSSSPLMSRSVGFSASYSACGRQAAAQSATNTYAQREKQDQKVADWKGGDTVVIAMSGGAFVLLLFLLLLI